MEELIFPEEGAVTGQRRLPGPHCGTEFDLNVDPGNADDRYKSSARNGGFCVVRVNGTVFTTDRNEN